MIDGTTLIFRIEILHNNIIQPTELFQFQLCPQEHILEVVKNVATIFLRVPLITCPITIVIEQEHRRLVFEEMIEIGTDREGIGLIVQTHQPRTQMIAPGVAIHAFFHF